MDHQSTRLGNRSSQQAVTATKNNSVGGVEKSQDFCRGIVNLNWEKELTAPAKTATKATPNNSTGGNPLREKRSHT
jgi:hypothetical protein